MRPQAKTAREPPNTVIAGQAEIGRPLREKPPNIFSSGGHKSPSDEGAQPLRVRLGQMRPPGSILLPSELNM
eukprot:3001542-Lingulodinium_polyedra.AAC.1